MPENDSAPRYRWTCNTCKREIVSWTERGLVNLRDAHEEKHREENKEIEREKAIVQAETAKRYETLAQTRTYNYLELSFEDINFLKTRGIAIDENVNYNKYMKHNPCYDTEPKNWKQILERAWPVR